MTNRLRIIGGEWRSRRISFATVDGLRPTPDRVRETLFNWLQFSIAGSRCLDLFAGSGILGIEAASRGASAVLLIEKDPIACAAIVQAIETLGCARFEVRRGDALEILAGAPKQPYDIVFADPPFRKALLAATVEQLDSHGWVRFGSKIYLEMEANSPPVELPRSWRTLQSQQAGEVAYTLCEQQ